ncbi:MAG: ribosome assembly cofactor RimP [Spirochaetaceae bacterium]|jgi:ribosome maturation factor RimP|nr:ribosome assembly cofactor RimP [Spirochaetaceae bacterium]
MRYTPQEAEPVFNSLETVVRGLGMTLIEVSVSQHRGSVQVRVTVDKGSPVGTDDCSRIHRAVIPRLELAFSGKDLYLEVSSPGINRLIKDGAEFRFYLGRGIRCYRTDISDWTGGVLLAADSEGITLNGKDGLISLSYGIITKARLEDGAFPESGGRPVLSGKNGQRQEDGTPET